MELLAGDRGQPRTVPRGRVATQSADDRPLRYSAVKITLCGAFGGVKGFCHGAWDRN